MNRCGGPVSQGTLEAPQSEAPEQAPPKAPKAGPVPDAKVEAKAANAPLVQGTMRTQ